MKKAKLDRYYLFWITEIIDYISKTEEKEWCTKVVRSGNSNCFFWHLHKMCKDDEEATFNWGMFEEQWATTYMIYEERPHYCVVCWWYIPLPLSFVFAHWLSKWVSPTTQEREPMTRFSACPG